jgi:OOP family OmpA-OmpF porin
MKILFFLMFLISFETKAEVIWADKLIGFSSEKSPLQYSASQVLGKPSVTPDFGETPCAWLVEELSPRIEWVKVSFQKQIKVRQIAVFENNYPGAVTGIYLYDSLDRGHRVHTNLRPEPIRKNGRIFRINIPKTDYRVYALKVEISLAKYFEPYQIDAIAISSDTTQICDYFNIIDTFEAFEPENIGKGVNSKFSEIAPVISPDGKTIYFTRENHPLNTYPFNDQDIWLAKKDSNGQFSNAINIGEPLNNRLANYVLSVSPDNNMLLTGGGYDFKKKAFKGLAKTYNLGDSWSFPVPIEINDYYNYSLSASYGMASNGKVLLLSLNREDSFGGNDLYVSFLDDNNIWTEPINIGNEVNTAANEASPFLASDNKTLYFATNGRPGFGNYDLFVTKRLDDSYTKWTEPKNLGNKINSDGWDAYFTIDAKGKFAYFVSNKNTYGKTDIFRIQIPQEIQPETVTLISGKVLNKKTNEPIAAKIIYEFLDNNEEAGIARSNPKTGDFSIILPNGKKYGYLAISDGFLSVNQNIDLTKNIEYQELTQNIFLVPAEKGEKISLNNIFFEFAQHNLLKESQSELNRLVKFMTNISNVRVQINGHTDNIGSSHNNMLLSEKRAYSVKEYLVSKGIDATRITLKGYGESTPIADNNTAEGRQLNRRVEFEIIE